MKCADCRWFDADANYMEADGLRASIGVCMWWSSNRTMTSLFNGVIRCPHRCQTFAGDNPTWCNAWEPREVDE